MRMGLRLGEASLSFYGSVSHAQGVKSPYEMLTHLKGDGSGE